MPLCVCAQVGGGEDLGHGDVNLDTLAAELAQTRTDEDRTRALATREAAAKGACESRSPVAGDAGSSGSGGGKPPAARGAVCTSPLSSPSGVAAFATDAPLGRRRQGEKEKDDATFPCPFGPPAAGTPSASEPTTEPASEPTTEPVHRSHDHAECGDDVELAVVAGPVAALAPTADAAAAAAAAAATAAAGSQGPAAVLQSHGHSHGHGHGHSHGHGGGLPPSPTAADKAAAEKRLVKMGMQTALAIGIHNFPEVLLGPLFVCFFFL